jgi:hypothetical protein
MHLTTVGVIVMAMKDKKIILYDLYEDRLIRII